MPDINRFYVMKPNDIEPLGHPFPPIYSPEHGWLPWVKEVVAERYRLVPSEGKHLLSISAEQLNELDTRVHCRHEEPLDFRVHFENRIYEFLSISELEAS